jgi:predicted MFS family arabinose efflux permease
MIFASSIPKFGGLRVVLVCLTIQTCGLLLLWRANSPHVAMLAAAIAAAGFSLVFPSLGVEAVKTVSLVNRGSVLGIFTAFFDLALGISGPAAGVIVTHAGYTAVFLFAAVTALGALGISALLYRRGPGREDFVENV